jgi:TonB family protein
MQDQSLNSKMDQSARTPDSPERRQRTRMLLAVLLLLVAVGVILFKDRDSLPSEGQSSSTGLPGQKPAVSEPPQPSAQVDTGNPGTSSHANLPAATGQSSPMPRIPNTTVSQPATRHHSATNPDRGGQRVPNPQPASNEIPAAGSGVTATRRVLPPLRIEVVAGDRPTPVTPRNPSLKVDMQPGTPAHAETEPAPSDATTPPDAAPLTKASERVQLATDTTQVLTHKVRPEYPLLARQMKVQGSVVLDALIGRDGGIQELQVVQGPTILADAAREAVRQWRFKPYLQDGRAVETQAHITVNFMISTN